MNREAVVNRILPFSCVDGPGNRLVIFLQGCNFNCASCHNPYTINLCNHCGDCVPACPEQALSLSNEGNVLWDQSLCTQCDKCIDTCSFHSSPKTSVYSVETMLEVIRKHHLFLSGITVSGGEATTQLPFVVELFRAVKSDSELKHLTCFIDSNGHLAESGWNKLIPVLDGAMIDLKSWKTDVHKKLTGQDNQKVIGSIHYLAQQQKLYELRLLYIPDQSDFDAQISETSSLIKQLPANVKVRLNAFQHHGVTGEALNWKKCGEEEMLQFYQQLSDKVEHEIVLPSIYF